jgi:hypothetical protein
LRKRAAARSERLPNQRRHQGLRTSIIFAFSPQRHKEHKEEPELLCALYVFVVLSLIR